MFISGRSCYWDEKFLFSLALLTVIYFPLWLLWNCVWISGDCVSSVWEKCAIPVVLFHARFLVSLLLKMLYQWRNCRNVFQAQLSASTGVFCVCACVCACTCSLCELKTENQHLSFSKTCPTFLSFFKKCFGSCNFTTAHLFIPVCVAHLTNKGTLDGLQVIKS